MAVLVGIQKQAVERHGPTAAIHSIPACSVVVLIDVEVGQTETVRARTTVCRWRFGTGAVMHALRRGCLSAAVGSAGTAFRELVLGRRRYANRRPICHAPVGFLQAPVTLSVTVVSCVPISGQLSSSLVPRRRRRVLDGVRAAIPQRARARASRGTLCLAAS